MYHAYELGFQPQREVATWLKDNANFPAADFYAKSFRLLPHIFQMLSKVNIVIQDQAVTFKQRTLHSRDMSGRL